MRDILRFSQLHQICESAAKKTHYPSVISYLHTHLPKDWWPMAESTVAFFLPRAILDLRTKLERREAIDSIPDDHPTDLKQFVKDGVTMLWTKERKKR